MSEADLALVLACVAAYNDGDLDRWASFLDPEVEAVPDAGFIESEPMRGRGRYRAWTEELTSGLEDPRWQTTESREVGKDRILVRGEWGGRGVTSGIHTSSNITGVFTVDSDAITRVEFYFDHQRALKAVGLQE